MRPLIAAVLILAASCAPRPEPADLVLRHGTIATMDPSHPQVEALAARGGRIVAVGSDSEIEAFVSPATEVVDLAGAFATPGLIESHAHFLGLGRARLNLDLTKARSWDEVVARVAEEAGRRPPGTWILGWGWHQEKWDSPPVPSVEGYPVHDALSRTVPDHPVLLKHASGGHGAIVNARAMQAAGIGPQTPDPPGGTIVRDEREMPTGMLRESAYDLARAAMDRADADRTPAEREADLRREIEVASRECLSKGITTFHDAHATIDEIDLFRKVAEEGKLGLRLWVMALDTPERLRELLPSHRWIGVADGHLTVRSVKQQIDGALGSHGAWLLEPYADHEGTGLVTTPVAEIEAVARLAIAQGFQLCVHAIGDRANRETLDLYERVFRENPDKKDLRWRIEHAQILAPGDVPRFAKLGVLAAMQGIHCTSDGPWVPKRLGDERARTEAYVWRDLLDAGAVISNGTDAPIEDVDPIPNIHASVTRRMGDGRAFYPEQRMSREEALRSYTVAGAYAGFEEDLKGTLTPGKLADVTVFSRDLRSVSDDEILGIRVLYTIVGGKVLHRAGP